MTLLEINEQFKTLFDERVKPEGDNGEPVKPYVDSFTEHFGWIYSAEVVAEIERITLDQAWELPTYQFLNDLVYAKEKRTYLDNKAKNAKHK